MFRDWIINNYYDVIEESLQELDMDGYHLSFLLDEKVKREERKAAIVESIPKLPKSPVKYHEQESNGLGMPKTLEIEQGEPPLNPKYTFETFVVGSCNQFAHAASLAVVDMPSKTYNPLYIYGGVGLGKTHLMHAIGQAIKARNNSLKLTYISSEKFMNELINAIRYDRTITFREKYRNIDILLMDDIQFLA